MRFIARALSAAVLAAALALGRARLHSPQDAAHPLRALAAAECVSDADCTVRRKVACLQDGTCGTVVNPLACWAEQQCTPEESKLCRRDAHCAGGATCSRSKALRYRTCQCPRNQIWRDLSGEAVCGQDSGSGSGGDGPDMMSAAGGQMGCGCPVGTFRESNGWCVPACCDGPLRAVKGSPCPQVCGQTINCLSGETIWDGGEASGASCACPNARPVLDPIRNQCVARQSACDSRTDAACPAPLVWHRFQPCPQLCGSEDQMCTAEERSGCGCPADKPYYDVEAAGCVASREECSGGDAGSGTGSGGEEGVTCEAPFVYFDFNKPCTQTCGEDTVVCADVIEPGCGCPADRPYLDAATNTCVASCECTGGRQYFAESKPCEQVCGTEDIFCGPLEAGCACAEGQKWSPASSQCVAANACDMRL